MNWRLDFVYIVSPLMTLKYSNINKSNMISSYANPIQSPKQLSKFLRSLDKVENGFIRVYRGQTQKYDTIQAHAHRNITIERRSQWNFYCGLLAEYLLNKEGTEEPGSTKSINDVDDFEIFYFWVKALSQHYGPGTEYLDVTHSLKVAIWFALNRIEKKTYHIFSGPPGDILDTDIIMQSEIGGYKPTNHNGWLYVFDLPEAKGKLTRTHGEMVDVLRNAPNVFKKGTRLSAQDACLAYCDSKDKDGDLTKFLVCPPIEIDPNYLSILTNDLNTSVLFPSPDVDEWYKRFLQTPYLFAGYTSEGKMVAFPSLPVTKYYHLKSDLNDPYFNSMLTKQIALTPLLVYPNQYISDQDKEAYQRALPILLASPLFYNCPSVESGKWHERLLWMNAGLSFSPDALTDPLSNENFNLHFEFSALEKPNWDEIDNGESCEWIRSIWVRAYNDNIIILSIGQQTFPKGDMRFFDMKLIFDIARNKILVQNLHSELTQLSNFACFAKPLFVVLAIIGDWLPGTKIKPYPMVETVGLKDNKRFTKATLVVSPESAQISPIIHSKKVEREYYSVFNIETKEPYASVGQYLKSYGIAVVKLESTFSEFPIEELYKSLSKTE